MSENNQGIPQHQINASNRAASRHKSHNAAPQPGSPSDFLNHLNTEFNSLIASEGVLEEAASEYLTDDFRPSSPKKKNKSNISEAALAASYHGSIVQSRRPVEPSETKKTSALTLERRLAQQLKSTGNLSDLKARGLD